MKYSPVFQGTTLLASSAESMVIIGSLWDTPRLPDTISVLLNVLGPAEASKLTVPFVLGASLVVAGGILRVQSFQTLGPYFTFEQCIRKDHKLVTHGPYAVIRHPGYSGLLMCILGWWTVHGSPGSWLRESGFLGVTWIKVGLVSWCFLTAASVVTLIRRSTEEDCFLSKRFGKEWESWARRVKYKLMPFVY
jgi:protein-S-isoprenylcysteine O-methyltransferase Ste14